jgi:hypothetical protein
MMLMNVPYRTGWALDWFVFPGLRPSLTEAAIQAAGFLGIALPVCECCSDCELG